MFEQFSEKAVVGTLLFLGWEILALAAIINVVMKARSAAGAWGWAMAIIALPFIAVPLYWILGRREFRGYVEKRKEAHDANERVYLDLLETLSPHFAELNPEQARYAGVLERLSERRFTTGNEVCLLINGEMTFDAIFRELDKAKEYILIQFFIVKDDKLGTRLRHKLLECAGRGVKVYFVYDEIGSHALGKDYVASLRAGGVEIHEFHSTQGPSNRFQINFRNHRKIVIVDGAIGFVGGHNVGDEYLGYSDRYGEWRDTHVQISGPAVLSLQMVFLADYYWATGVMPTLNWNRVIEGDGSHCGSGKSIVLTLPTGPIQQIEGGTIFFLNAITRAVRRVWIASPYFVTDESIRSALQMAALRGVDVRILIPDKPDKYIPWLATFSFLGEMEAAGVRIFRYEPGFLHQKVVLVDDEMSAVGTANLDNRSMRLNFEVTAVILCRDMASQVEAMLEQDFLVSREVGGDEFTSRNWWFRVGVRLARLAAPVL
ncbi:cardiolipin synthase [Verrucomicrobiales bacterium BCK34]|nr:cardiolipin synthase [Verrucomicrobiales bacterium BCK34]